MNYACVEKYCLIKEFIIDYNSNIYAGTIKIKIKNEIKIALEKIKDNSKKVGSKVLNYFIVNWCIYFYFKVILSLENLTHIYPINCLKCENIP